MELGVTKVFVLILMLTTITNAVGQSVKGVQTPPILKSGEPFLKSIRLTYTEKPNIFRTVSIKFKVSSEGNLDTLVVSDNTPSEFAISIREQLNRLNGQWKSQYLNGHPVASKWVIIRFYITGYKEDSNECLNKQEADFIAAYKREADLFDCSVDLEHPMRCKTAYLEGYDYFLYPPWLSRVER
ncbi:hypothetical protein G8759_08060 [Spirosoma aureum]|uniref:Uncharacterized protein n=1 Tax=Spirosoma aureum TaxID=2692134 RepID=A0A6G9AJF2_9BACT|nr:hypothetical protein [Spirosoma aureum]QIP12578.1 hypothetical protein G8759_08060 [Spirosoma aureum]